jgi:ubiquinone/menaquinone biosynthesis C-methylase UbiE
MAFLNPEEIAKKLPLEEGLVVADFGAGTGSFAIPVAKRVGMSGRVYAVEVNKDLAAAVKVAATREKLSNVEIIWGDIEAPNGTKLANSSVGLVILSNVLFQVENKEAAVKEAHRILKTRGYALVLDWKESFGGLGPRPEDIMQGEAVKKLFLNSGFSLYNELEAGEYHYAYLFQKF